MFKLFVNKHEIHVLRPEAVAFFGEGAVPGSTLAQVFEFKHENYEPDFPTLVKTISGLLYEPGSSSYVEQQVIANDDYFAALGKFIIRYYRGPNHLMYEELLKKSKPEWST